jgi:hypothetical protein
VISDRGGGGRGYEIRDPEVIEMRGIKSTPILLSSSRRRPWSRGVQYWVFVKRIRGFSGIDVVIKEKKIQR